MQQSFVPVVHAAINGRPHEANTVKQAEGVAAALNDLGYTSEVVRVGLDLTPLRALAHRRPLVVFNLVAAVEGDVRMAPFALAAMERLGLACTGARFEPMVAALSKQRCKELLELARLPTPPWSGSRTPPAGDRLVLVKSDSEHASVGIEPSSVVLAAEALRVIAEREQRFGGRFFAETYVDGREFTIAILEGPEGVEVLPVLEIHFENDPTGKPRILDYDTKWRSSGVAFTHTPIAFGLEEREPALARKLKRLALECWTVFGMSGYGRIDVRVDGAGKPWVIDIDLNPGITRQSGIAAAAEAGGIAYATLVERIVMAALPPVLPGSDEEQGPCLTEVEFRR
jgi:D-alanine-D-alanine ligase